MKIIISDEPSDLTIEVKLLGFSYCLKLSNIVLIMEYREDGDYDYYICKIIKN